jgi:hypothetical protein
MSLTRYECGHVGKVVSSKKAGTVFIRVAEVRRQILVESSKKCGHCGGPSE